MLKQSARSISALIICVFLLIGAAAPASGNGDGTGHEDKTSIPPTTQGAVPDIVQTGPSRPEGAPSVASTAAPSSVIMTEGFEGAWPNTGWYLIDISDTDGGEYLLGDRVCHPHTGYWSGWMIGGGAQGYPLDCSAVYPLNVNTWAMYGPFDLRWATSATLSFHLWGVTEYNDTCSWDFLYAASSLSDGNWYGTRYCGDWSGGSTGNGYYYRTLDLSSRLGQSEVWVAFAFYSDDSVQYNGITIDDVTLDIVAQNLGRLYLPLVLRAPPPACPDDPTEPNGTFDQAVGPLTLNQDFLGYFNCDSDTDRDYYYFEVTAARQVIVTLQNIPAGSDYNLTLYNSNRIQEGYSGNLYNADERIDMVVGTGYHYVRITRGTSPLVSQPYRLRVATP